MTTMTPTRSEPTDLERFETIYREHATLLRNIATSKFRVDPADAETIVHEVFLSFLAHVSRVEEPRKWLVAAICNGCRNWLRRERRTVGVEEALGTDWFEEPRDMPPADDILALHQTLATLPERYREILRLHYFEGLSAAEIARELQTTNRYAEKLIHKGLSQMRRAFSVGGAA